jgi:hypothetical protein
MISSISSPSAEQNYTGFHDPFFHVSTNRGIKRNPFKNGAACSPSCNECQIYISQQLGLTGEPVLACAVWGGKRGISNSQPSYAKASARRGKEYPISKGLGLILQFLTAKYAKEDLGCRFILDREPPTPEATARLVGCGFILQPDGLIHTSPGHRPGWVMVVGGQAESLHHTWLVFPHAYEAGLQPAMCFLTCDPGRRPLRRSCPGLV